MLLEPCGATPGSSGHSNHRMAPNRSLFRRWKPLEELIPQQPPPSRMETANEETYNRAVKVTSVPPKSPDADAE
ncbi:hypothetical protein ZHAS_00015844 [Anopheles sinensis]|uniref:Uncharacterized protein n=1 Tax=Anopheles sinensis TaxID=74873 RepID=A0A084WC29_ANOSI|nr:hypothetical protein ZHAS_00015844 [Anopheles sinensis]